jgi:hypothetical protein
MLITTANTSPNLGARKSPNSSNLSLAEQQTTIADSYSPSEASQEPKELYPAWTPLANAGVAAAVVAIPAFLGAAGQSAFGSSEFIPLGVSLVAGGTAGTLAYRSAHKEFRGHPVLTGIRTVAAGGVSAVVAPFLSLPGAAYGWKGAAIATAIAAIGTGVISAFGVHSANQKIAQHNASLPRPQNS